MFSNVMPTSNSRTRAGRNAPTSASCDCPFRGIRRHRRRSRHDDRRDGRPRLWLPRPGAIVFDQCPSVDQLDTNPQIRHAGTNRQVPARSVRRLADRRQRSKRASRRLRYLQHANPRRPRRRQLRAQRLEDLGHQRARSPTCSSFTARSTPSAASWASAASLS